MDLHFHPYGDEESAAYLLLSWNGEKFETLLQCAESDHSPESRMHQKVQTLLRTGESMLEICFILSVQKQSRLMTEHRNIV